MAQDSTRPSATMSDLYFHHVGQANIHEVRANKRRLAIREVIEHRNPNASKEWIDTEASKDHYFKAYVATQQFHVRQASMYGVGAILEALSSRR